MDRQYFNDIEGTLIMRSRAVSAILVFVAGGMVAIMLQTVYRQMSENRITAPENDYSAIGAAPAERTVEIAGIEQQAQPAVAFVEEEVVADEIAPTSEQRALYEQIVLALSNPSYLQDVTVDDLFQKMNQLTGEQNERLIVTAREMLSRGELKLEYFKKPVPRRHRTVAEGAPLPSREEQGLFDQVAGKLADPAYTEHVTYIELSQQIQPLPPALKQEVANMLNSMLRNGEIDAGSFLGPRYAGKKDITLFFN